jgi:hypothetical protein
VGVAFATDAIAQTHTGTLAQNYGVSHRGALKLLHHATVRILEQLEAEKARTAGHGSLLAVYVAVRAAVEQGNPCL